MKLTTAQINAWRTWCEEVVNGDTSQVITDPDEAIAFIKWTAMMNNSQFCLIPQNSPEFRSTMAGLLPQAERNQLADIAGLAHGEAFAMPLPMVANLARRAVATKKRNDAPTRRGPKPDPDAESIVAAYIEGETDYYNIVEKLQLKKKWKGRLPYARVKNAIAAYKKRLKSKKGV
jgi:hypothetical protein